MTLQETTQRTCAECARVISEDEVAAYEDGRLWHGLCWPARRARMRLVRRREYERKGRRVSR